MKKKENPAGPVKTFRPTGKKILESLEGIMVMTSDNPNRRAFGSRFKVPRVIELAGFSPDIYLDVKEQYEYLHKLTADFLCIMVLKTR